MKALGFDFVGDDKDDPFGSGQVRDLRKAMQGRSKERDPGQWVALIGGLLIVAFWLMMLVAFVRSI